ncbi:inositol 2-dehydrogenase [Acuticoccus sp. M5D2P5]|uniref:inositol 2-dehydrogenase n=1 Tax=Acuticoccus kalidii TaxID=2910977 RepID=UPI001F3C3728|nr:inositol 2-dehydrogenase [Acuticoccus kalidii]MCF3935241.1 inositol 2-dehydrogenase [Acuticoccus kalidii]
MVAVAVLGCGRIGQMHARNIARHPRTTLASVFDVHGPSAQKVAETLGVPVAASPEAIFADPAVDAVVIASSTDTHVDLLKMSVAARKPVLCEKPIDLSLSRVEDCAKAIAGTDIPIFLGFVRRFDPTHAAVAQAVRDGTIGTLHQVVVTSRDPGLASEAYLTVSGGIFRDMTIHDFDMARFVLGEEVSEVVAFGARLVDPALMERIDDIDTVSVLMRTAGGRQAIINNSRRAVYGYDQRVEAFGSAGMVASNNCRPNAMTAWGEGFTEKAAPLLDFFIERYTEAFNTEIAAFADAVEGKAAPAVTFEDGRQAQRLAEAATLSAREGRIVKLAELG